MQFTEAAARPAGQEANIVGDLEQRNGRGLERSAGGDRLLLTGLGGKVILGFAQRQPGRLGQPGNHPLGKLRVGVEAGAHRRAAEREFAQAVGGAFQLAGDQGDLAEVAAEHLAEADRRGILQVGAGDGDDIIELAGLLTEGLAQGPEGRQQEFVDFDGGGQVHDGGDDVVARLAVVDVVVGMHGPAAEGFAEQLAGPIGDHLVGVHVGAGSGAGLEDVEGEVVVQIADDHLFSGVHDRQGGALVDQAELPVDLGGMFLDHAEGAQEGSGKADPRDRKIVAGPCGLGSVEGFGGHGHGAHGVLFDAGG